MKKITLMAILATAFATTTLQSCKKDEDKAATPSTPEIRDLAVGKYYGVSMITSDGDTYPDTTEMIITKGSGNTLLITDTEGVVIKTGDAKGSKESLAGEIPGQTVKSPDGISSNITGQGAAGKHFSYTKSDSTFKCSFKATFLGETVLVNFTGKK